MRGLDISALFAQAGQHNDDSTVTRPILEAQASLLRERFPLAQRALFSAGDFVAHKAGFSVFKPEFPIAMAFVRYLDPTDRLDFEIIRSTITRTSLNVSGPSPDCICATTSDDGGDTFFSVWSSCLLETDARAEVRL